MDALLPGIGNWQNVWLFRDLWRFHFTGEFPLQLVAGRERTYFEHFWNDFAADKTKSVPKEDRQFYAASYAQPGGMRAGFGYFEAFEQDAKALRSYRRQRSRRRWAALNEAQSIVPLLPPEQVGTCVVSPAGELLRTPSADLSQAIANGDVTFHAGSIRGAWPRLA